MTLFKLLKLLVILSPSKTSDPASKLAGNFSLPGFIPEIGILIKILKKKKLDDLKDLMRISDKLASQTFDWIKVMTTKYEPQNTRCAIYNFSGEVYQGLKAETLSELDLEFAQNHLRILSGLYGSLRPLDLMQPYRLEMGTRLKTSKSNNLYQFWGGKITKSINADLKSISSNILLNLASDEYSKCIIPDKLKAVMLSVEFFETKNGNHVFNSFNAKKARGQMAGYIIRNKVIHHQNLRLYNIGGYHYNEKLSSQNNMVFVKS